MLNRLQLQNFKAWREAHLTFGRVTGLFGTNSAGKSSLLQFLLLLKQTRNATDRGLVLDFGGPLELVNLGGFMDVVHRHAEDERIRWRLDWTLPKPLKITDPLNPRQGPLFTDHRLEALCEVGHHDNRLWPRELTYRIADVSFRLQPTPDKKRKFTLVADGSDFSFLRNRGRPWALPPPAKSYLFPSETRSYFQNADFLGDLELAYENLMDSIYYLGPLREYPQRQYNWAGSMPQDVGRHGERTMEAMLAATARNEHRSLGFRKRYKSFQEMIAHWLRRLGLIHDFQMEEIGANMYRAMVRTPQTNVPTPLTDVGFGVSQVLPMLVLLYYVPEKSTVLMEQPEIHLHPAVQSGLADVMLNVAKARNVQIVVESHSEHLMRRLQRRVAEEKVSSEDVKLYFVSSNKGAAQLSDLRLNEWGAIESWPDNFFGDEMGEMAAISEASLRRRMEQSG